MITAKGEFLTPTNEDVLISYLNKNVYVTDEFHLNRNDDMALHELWMGKGNLEKEYSVPLDLILENHVPAPNIRMIVDERGYLPMGQKTISEVLFYPNALTALPRFVQSLKDTYENLPIGVIKNICDGHEIIWHMQANIRLNVFCVMGQNVLFDKKPRVLKAYFAQEFGKVAFSILHTWYGIQIALLHPQIKDVFASERKPTKTSNRSNNRAVTQRVTHYIKKHYKCGKIASTVNRHIKRKTLCWWVIGHWREYSDGRKTFVSGYWKGPLREAKQNLDNTRKRIL